MSESSPTSIVKRYDVFSGGGDMGERIRTFLWHDTALGSRESWPQSLKTALSLILSAQMPMWLGWGPNLHFFYNDAYVQVLGAAKHPWALGRPASEVWREIWDVCGPLADRVLLAGEAPFVEDVRLFMDRGDFVEEVYYSFSYSPIRDESGGVGGLFCPNTEVTAKLLNARRLRTLSELAAKAYVERTPEAACVSAAETISKNRDDVPFALLYLASEHGDLRLEQKVGLEPADSSGAPPRVDVRSPTPAPWPIADVFTLGRMRTTRAPHELSGLPLGLADQRIREVITQPIVASDGTSLGVLVAGVSPARRLDQEYATFFGLLAGQVATAIQNARAAEEARRRAETLAELDRAKTAFFTNVSHEFRTPLTLMIGPTEDALGSPEASLSGPQLETVYRNELRLLKLVNALLDFSRIEAGRMTVSYETLDLAVLTTDIASSFRSAIEAAGLTFKVATPVRCVASVDPDLWEKITLNLLSNALKFTVSGSIELTLLDADAEVTLEVKDTGTGIPTAELPRLFERFHRIQNPLARTQEGSGIGLALVHELAKLHGGSVTAESELGRGTTFRVTVPKRSSVARPASSDAQSRSHTRNAFVAEAHRWTPDSLSTDVVRDAPRILVADDNADMRDYVARLLSSRWRVTAVADGTTALESARQQRPDLILSDVMMPGLDGFELLAALRRDEQTRSIPFILLSARAGDEARVSGLQAGADDYLIKPFSARELIARITTHLALAKARSDVERSRDEIYDMFMQVPAAITVRRGDELRCVFQNAASLAIVDQRGKSLSDLWPREADVWQQPYRRALETGVPVTVSEVEAKREWPSGGSETRYWDVTYAPVRLPDGTIDGVMAMSFEVTDRVRARHAAEESEAKRNLAFAAAHVGWWRIDLDAQSSTRDSSMNQILGLDATETTQPLGDFLPRVHPEDRERVEAALNAAIVHGDDYLVEHRIVRPDGTTRWVRDTGRALRDNSGRTTALVGAAIDITEQKNLAEEALAASRAKDEFLAMLGHELRNPLAPITAALELLAMRGLDNDKVYQTMDRQVRHLTRLVDDLLDISRLTRGHIELKRERVAIRDVIAKSIEMASPMVEAKQHHLSVDAPDGLWVNADPVRLAQVFANLLTNAARYTPNGGRISVSAFRIDDEIVVHVADNGIGITEEMQGRVFDLFFQAGGRDSRLQGGLGIGLALVRSLTRLHGGEVTVHSNGPNAGSDFVVRLPAARSEQASVAPATTSLAPGTHRVLVVDDNEDAAELLSEALRSFGHEVVIAHDGPGAIVLAQQFRPDAAILDIGLPVMDGYELARRLRDDGIAPRFVVALTGYGQEQDRERSAAAGFDAHLVKPVDIKKLHGVLSEHLRSAES